jgi:hypothetical protein
VAGAKYSEHFWKMIGGLLTTTILDEMGPKYKGEMEAVIL